MNHGKMSTLALSLAASSAATAQCTSNFAFTDFSGAGGDVTRLTMSGDALFTGGVMRLTPDYDNQRGSSWYTLARSGVGAGFSTRFTFRISSGTADGFAFVIQNQAPNAIGGMGSGMGYATAGIPGITRSVAVEFDTFDIGSEFDSPHVSVQSRGNSPNEFVDAASIFHAPIPFRITDGNPHDVIITYVPRLLTVDIDGGAFMMNVVLDLHDIYGADILDPGNDCAWVGFTAGAGAASARQDIERWSFDDSYGCTGPQFTQTPDAAPRVAYQRAEWTMAAAGAPPIAYEWRRNGAPLADGGRISGASTGTLVIDPVLSSDAGLITYSASNECGVISGEFSLDVSCFADFNADGGIDGGDVSSFFGSWEAGTTDSDVNQDGGIDGGDVQTFFTAWEGGGCN